jgi:HK97 family phage prohead protease
MHEQVATFVLDTKATVTELDGELIIEGYASDFDTDRQDEAFEPGAFDAAIKSFMENPVLLYHHQFDKALGRVLELTRDAKGLLMRAVLDKPAAGSWAEDIYNKVASGSIKGLSVGGKFHRKMTDAGPKIHKADLMEISVTPMPVNPRTLFAVAGKAFESFDDLAEQTRTEEQIMQDLSDHMDMLGGIFDDVIERVSQ